MMKNSIKYIVLALLPILLSSIAHAELKHPTCKIHLANMNALLISGRVIKEAKKDTSIKGMIPRKKTIVVLKKYKYVDVNSMLANALKEKGYITSFQGDEEAIKKENFSIRNYKPKGLNSDVQSKDIRVYGKLYEEKMSGNFNLITMTKRKKYYNGFATELVFSVNLKISDPQLSENKTNTFFKITAEVIIKDGDANAAFEEVIAKALRDAPQCEIN